MVLFEQLRDKLIKAPDRLDIQIQIENQWPVKWAQWLTDNRFMPIDHPNQAPEHCQHGYGSKGYWRSMNPGA